MSIYNTILCIISPLYQISNFFPLIKSRKNTIVEYFFCYLSKWECKKYICGTLPFTALKVYPTMTTSAAGTRKCEKGLCNIIL